MTVKIAIILLWIILFVISLIRIFILGSNNKLEKIRSTYIIITICTIIMGIILVVLLNFTKIGDEYIFKITPKEEKIKLKEQADVYNVYNVYYLYKKGVTSYYIVTIGLEDGAKKIIEVKELLIYNTLNKDQTNYIEIYKNGPAKLYLKKLTDENISNNVDIIEIKAEDEEISINTIESEQTIEEVESAQKSGSLGITIVAIVIIVLIILGGAVLLKNC